jgi:hypothetical protein
MQVKRFFAKVERDYCLTLYREFDNQLMSVDVDQIIGMESEK